jgi:hypothetical protein
MPQLHQPTPDGALRATQKVSDVTDAAMSQFQCLDGSIATAVAFGQGGDEYFHRLFDVFAVSGVSHSV